MKEITTDTKKIISYLAFRLGDESFALNVGNVINILELQNITKIPKAPDYIPGIINLRGVVLPVVDTNIKLGIGQTKTTSNMCILVVESEISDSKVKFGILVDTVQEVLEIEDDKILPSPTIGEKYQTELITGVVEQSDRFILILDINKLLEFNEVLDLQQISKSNKK